MKALLFGSIGVFCDSSDLQRNAYNQAFEEAGLDWYWDAPLYRNLLLTPDGRARIARFAREYDTDVHIDADALHRRKTDLFALLLEEQQQAIRSGVIRLVKSARSNGIKVGWVTSTEYSNLMAVLLRCAGSLSASDFDVVTHRETVTHEKPDPAPYLRALSELGIEPEHAVAIEDTAACMRSATRAEIACVVTPNQFSLEQDYYEADAIVSALGDPGASASQLGGLSLVDDQGLVTISGLQKLTEFAVS